MEHPKATPNKSRLRKVGLLVAETVVTGDSTTDDLELPGKGSLCCLKPLLFSLLSAIIGLLARLNFTMLKDINWGSQTSFKPLKLTLPICLE